MYRLLAALLFACVFGNSHGALEQSFFQNGPFLSNILKIYTLQSNAVSDEKCRNQSKAFVTGLSEGESWAVKMFDASSKLQSGLMSGNIRDLGAFDQCLEVRATNTEAGNFGGQHCYASIIPRFPANMKEILREANDSFRVFKGTSQMLGVQNEFENRAAGGESPQLMLKWSICVPDGCSSSEIENHLNSILPKILSNFITVKVPEYTCQTSESIKANLRPGDWAFIAFLIFIFILMVACTAYDIYLKKIRKEPTHKILIAFSVYTNGQKLLMVNKGADQLTCLHGMRCISMMWVVLGHRYFATVVQPNVNSFDVIKWTQQYLSQIELGSTVTVDTFFMLGGCLLMYLFMKSQSKGARFNIPLFYLHRYLRLTPALAVVIVFNMTILQYLGSGPRWDSAMVMQRDPCINGGWWKDLLYIQNYFKDPQCIAPGWYLAVDMQLYWISPLILLPVWHWRRHGLKFLGALTCVFIIVPTTISYCKSLFAGMFVVSGIGGNNNVEDYNYYYYMSTYSRAGTWIVGLALGYLLFETRNQKIQIKKWVLCVLWLASTVMALYVLFGMYHTYQKGYIYGRWFNSLFNGFHRVAWCLAIGWVIFACVHGYAEPVNWILSLPTFQILGRFTYSIYLFHMNIQQLRIGVLRSPGHFSNLDSWYLFWGDLIFSLLVAVVWVLAFESPIGVIDSVLFGGAKRYKTPKQERVENKKNEKV